MSFSTTVKAACVGLLVLVLSIPACQITSLVGERQQRRDEAVREMQASWSAAQTVDGPFLRLPIRLLDKDEKGRTFWRKRTLFVLPDSLEAQGDLKTEERHRGIYRTALYTAGLRLSGRFSPPDMDKLDLKGWEIEWDRASFVLGITDLRGFKGGGVVDWGGKAVPLDTDKLDGPAGQALSAPVPAGALLEGARRVDFALDMGLMGSQSLRFVPVGRTTSVALKSPWRAPSFRGDFLPETRTVDANGFSAAWKVTHLNRSLPPATLDAAPGANAAQFGVDLFVPVDQYTSVNRALKYELLFVFLTFLVFFFTEHFQEKRLHPMQYLLVGAGIVLFYLLLLSFSEHLPFLAAYVLSAAAIVAVVAGYAHAVFAKGRVTAALTSFLSGLYAYLYTLLRLEDYALLLGSLGLLSTLATVMYFTRRFDWYAQEAAAGKP